MVPYQMDEKWGTSIDPLTVSFWSLVTVEIVICFAILIIWAIRLVKKGNKLVEKDVKQNSKKNEGSIDSVV